MIRGAIEFAHDTFKTNLETDLAAIVSAAGVIGLDTSINLYKRQQAEVFLSLPNLRLPGLGIYALSAQTNAKTVRRRMSIVTLVADYVVVHADAAKAAETAELAVEAIMMSIDRMVEGGSGNVAGAGLIERSVSVTLARASQVSTRNPMERAMVRFPVDVWDPVT